MNMRLLSVLLACVCVQAFAAAADFQITSYNRQGAITWSNAFRPGVASVETSSVVTGGWSVVKNVFTSNSVATVAASLSSSNTFVRVLAVDISTNAAAH